MAGVGLHSCVFGASADHVYTVLLGPTAWRAPETFAAKRGGRQMVSAASDVFMLGCAMIEVLTGCERHPYDWLAGEDLLVYRKQDSTCMMGPIQVRG